MTFLCLNINDDYNYGMEVTNIANQLCGSYCFDKWMRNYKWWHAIFWWGFQVILVNSYNVYCCYYEERGLIPISHYEFQKRVGQACLDAGYHTKKANHDMDASASYSSMSTGTVSAQGRRSCVSAQLLNPMDDSLKHQMDKTISYLAKCPRTPKAYCQLHYLATGNKYSNCAHCANFNVILCLDNCFELFHSEWNLHQMKADMKEKMFKK